MIFLETVTPWGAKKTIYPIICIANLDLCLYSWLFYLGHNSHGNTPLSFVLCLTVRRNYDKIRTVRRCGFNSSRSIFQDGFRRRLAEPLHRSYRASPHSRGRGALRCDA